MSDAVTEVLWERVKAQRTRVPALYGQVDFSTVPERFTATPGDPTSLSGKYTADREALLGRLG